MVRHEPLTLTLHVQVIPPTAKNKYKERYSYYGKNLGMPRSARSSVYGTPQIYIYITALLWKKNFC